MKIWTAWPHKMVAVSSSKMFVIIYQSTWLHIQENRLTLFWDITWHVVVILHWCYRMTFGPIHDFLTLEDGTDGCHEMSVRNYHYTLRNILERCMCHTYLIIFVCGSLKSWIFSCWWLWTKPHRVTSEKRVILAVTAMRIWSVREETVKTNKCTRM